MADNRRIGDFIDDSFNMLNIKGLHVHSRRGWLYKTLEDYTKRIEATGEPGKQLFWSRRWHEADARGERSTRREHSYPLGQITDEFAAEDRPWQPVGKEKLSQHFHELVLCYITEEEDNALNDTVFDGVILKTQMPLGATCRFARYHASKLPIDPTRTPPRGWRTRRVQGVASAASATNKEATESLKPACGCKPR